MIPTAIGAREIRCPTVAMGEMPRTVRIKLHRQRRPPKDAIRDRARAGKASADGVIAGGGVRNRQRSRRQDRRSGRLMELVRKMRHPYLRATPQVTPARSQRKMHLS